jgi:predicted nucleic acid-binding Zn ribbon protein
VKRRAVAISDVVSDIMRKLETGRGSQAEALNAGWARAIGQENLRHAKPVELKDGILIVHVDSSSWIHKLSMEKAKILVKMKNEAGEDVIKDIKLRIGEL